MADERDSLEELEEDLQKGFRLRPLLKRVLDRVLDVSGAERGAILHWNGHGARVVVARGRPGRAISPEVRELSQSIAKRAVTEGRAWVIHDTTEAPSLILGPSVAALGIRALACFPFWFQGRAVGVVYLDSRRSPLARLEENRAFLEVVGRRVGTAWTVARLLEQRERARRALERANRKLRGKTRVQGRQIEAARRWEVRVRSRSGGDERTPIVASSPAMRRVMALAEAAAADVMPVLLVGPTGVGKDLVARFIHERSPRREARFVAVNCASLTESLLEDELFGHAEGAFTGAREARAGLIEVAHRGTLLLDEIAEMKPALQAKLLRVLEEGEVRRVGSNEPVALDVRFVAATSRGPREIREDLYYRLAGLVIPIPPLRERPEDLPDLVESCLARWARERGVRAPVVTPGAMRLLRRHAWPGNVRELQQVLGAVRLESRGPIRPAAVRSALAAQPTAEGKKEARSLQEAVDRFTAEYVRRVVSECRSLEEARRRLGMDRTTFWRLRRKHRL